jgi:Cu(I)/Ag(I) efflux system membrane fusion protein
VTDPDPEHPEDLREGAEAPPPGVGLMAALRWLLLLAAIAAAGAAWWSWAHADPAVEHAPKYRCPMHPQVTSPTRGECPICGMDLEEIPPEAAPAKLYRCPMHPQIQQDTPGECPICGMDLEEVAPPPAPATAYRCPMHPQIQQDTPGECPICGMDLEPVQLADESHVSSDMPPGTAAITLELDRLQAIGARIAVAEERELAAELRSAALTEFSEDGAAQVHVRAAGYIERIAVDETGVRVRKGQVLAEYYSPEIYQAQAELLAARGWTGPALAAARQRLELLGVSSAAVDRLLKTGKIDRTTAVLAPASGVVVARNAVLGAYIRPEEPLYELRADQALYLVAEVPASRAAAVRVGARGRVRFTGRPELDQDVAVDLVYPAVDRDSRSVRVRMPLADPERRLVAGAPAVVTFQLAPERGVAVPRDAVVDAGAQPYVFVDLGGGRLAPRTVTLGPKTDALVLVREGLRPGDRVVAGATFLVDAESRLRAAMLPPAKHDHADMSHAPQSHAH